MPSDLSGALDLLLARARDRELLPSDPTLFDTGDQAAAVRDQYDDHDRLARLMGVMSAQPTRPRRQVDPQGWLGVVLAPVDVGDLLEAADEVLDRAVHTWGARHLEDGIRDLYRRTSSIVAAGLDGASTPGVRSRHASDMILDRPTRPYLCEPVLPAIVALALLNAQVDPEAPIGRHTPLHDVAFLHAARAWALRFQAADDRHRPPVADIGDVAGALYGRNTAKMLPTVRGQLRHAERRTEPISATAAVVAAAAQLDLHEPATQPTLALVQ